MIPRQIINHHMLEEMQVKNGKIQVNIEKDILKLAVVERYGKNGNVGVGFVRGFELKKALLHILCLMIITILSLSEQMMRIWHWLSMRWRA